MLIGIRFLDSADKSLMQEINMWILKWVTVVVPGSGELSSPCEIQAFERCVWVALVVPSFIRVSFPYSCGPVKVKTEPSEDSGMYQCF